jgi:hypothetical protein
VEGVPALYLDYHVSSQAFEARQTPVKLDDPDRWRKYLEARALPGLELSEITKPGGSLPSKVRNAKGLGIWGFGVWGFLFVASVFVLRVGVFQVMKFAYTGSVSERSIRCFVEASYPSDLQDN